MTLTPKQEARVRAVTYTARRAIVLHCIVPVRTPVNDNGEG